MFEKVNPSHPDKIADRIAGALVDLAYKKNDNPIIAVEVLLGHGECNIIGETSIVFTDNEITSIVNRIAGKGLKINYNFVQQDEFLSKNQKGKIRCGDNGIFKGSVVTEEQKHLTELVKHFYQKYPFDGKYLIANNDLTVCQSNVKSEDFIKEIRSNYHFIYLNPLGDWTGGLEVDSGATNRKLGSDMGDSITGGGLHGKDLSKADVSVNIYVWLQSQIKKEIVELSCSIGDITIDGKPYEEIVKIAKDYIDSIGGFEKFAEWGLIS